MSILQMVKVWEHEFPHPEQAVMLALADHAHDNGEGIHPAIDRIAWKTGYARRNVQLILKRLKGSGVVVETKPATPKEPAHLKFDWSKAQPKPSYEAYKAGKQKNSEQGCKDDTPDEDGDTNQGYKDDTPDEDGDTNQGYKDDTPDEGGDTNQGCKDDTPDEGGDTNQGCKDDTPEKGMGEGCKDYTPDGASEVIDGSSQGCNGDHPRGDQVIISGVIAGSPDPSIQPSIQPSSKTPLAPQGGILSPPASPKILPIGQPEAPEGNSEKLDSLKPDHGNSIGEPEGSGAGKHSGRGGSQRQKRQPKGKTKQAADAYERRLELDPEFEARCDRLRAQWAPFIVQLRGHYCDPQAFRRGYAWLISEWAGEFQMAPTEVEEGLSYYVESKLAQVQAGQQPTSPPDGIRFFTGKAADSDHPTPYCWLALQRKRDRAGVGEVPLRRKKYGIDRQGFVERIRQKQAQQEVQHA
jgi:hypothetical protein